MGFQKIMLKFGVFGQPQNTKIGLMLHLSFLCLTVRVVIVTLKLLEYDDANTKTTKHDKIHVRSLQKQK